MALTADGKQAVSASSDNTLKVWDLETGDRPQEEECNSQDQRMAVRFIMNGTWKSKMEILDETEA